MILGVMAFIAAVMVPSFAQPGQGQGQGRGGPGGGGQGAGMMGAMIYLERSWTAVSFQLDCTGEQIEQLHPTYLQALQTRQEAVKAATEKQDREALMQAMTDCKATLETALQTVLNDEQWANLQTLMEAPMGGMGRGGRGGRGAQ